MGLETGDHISDLIDTNPLGTDPVSEGDDHLRLVKRCLQGNTAGDVPTTTLLAAALAALIVRHNGATQTQWITGVLNDTLAILGSVAAEGDTVLARFDPAGSSELLHAGEDRFGTTANGVEVGAAATVGRVLIRDNDDVDALTMDAASAGVSMNGLVEDVVLALNGTPTGGGGVPLFTGDPNGTAALFYAGVLTVQTIASMGGSNGGIRLPGFVDWTTGIGSPEGVVSAGPGSLYSELTSGSSKPLWMKNFGALDTGWLAVQFQP